MAGDRQLERVERTSSIGSGGSTTGTAPERASART
jgi:hypothetical protein